MLPCCLFGEDELLKRFLVGILRGCFLKLFDVIAYITFDWTENRSQTICQ